MNFVLRTLLRRVRESHVGGMKNSNMKENQKKEKVPDSNSIYLLFVESLSISTPRIHPLSFSTTNY